MSRRLRSDLAHSTPDRITVRGQDLAAMIGKVSLGDFAFLELKGRLPTPQESSVFNAIAITLVEHGVTPSALAARLTYLGAPESLQGAVAAGLLGLGDRYGGPVGDVARMLQEAAESNTSAAEVVAAYRSQRRPIPGLGHPIHKPEDPRVRPLLKVAEENGFLGPHVGLMLEIAAEAAHSTGRQLPLNATGAIGALACELDFPWQICRGIAVMARAIGLVAHIQEEVAEPMAAELWARAESETAEGSIPE